MFKAYLVGREFEDKLMNERTDSLTCSWQVLQIVFVLASIFTSKSGHYPLTLVHFYNARIYI